MKLMKLTVASKQKGMTLKQWARSHYLDICNQLAVMRRDGILGPEFIRLSVEAHALRGTVPRRLWPLATRVADPEIN